MFGPAILERTLSKAVPTGKRGQVWQYHSRGDRHSKVACWGVLLDLMLTSRLLFEHVKNGQVAFGINHEMRDFRQNRKKDLDLVLCTPAPTQAGAPRRSFEDLVELFQVELSADEASVLAQLPPFMEAPVGSVLVALEAKACMTAHVKAIPRLYDELNSSHQTVHGASEIAIAAGLVMVNVSEEFVSPGRVAYCSHCGHRVTPLNVHKQPADAIRVVEKMKELPRRSSVQGEGFDALAIVPIECRNDGSEVRIVSDPPAPPQGDIFQYEQAIVRLAQLYESRFPRV